jgi:hypothetical protein
VVILEVAPATVVILEVAPATVVILEVAPATVVILEVAPATGSADPHGARIFSENPLESIFSGTR